MCVQEARGSGPCNAVSSCHQGQRRREIWWHVAEVCHAYQCECQPVGLSPAHHPSLYPYWSPNYLSLPASEPSGARPNSTPIKAGRIYIDTWPSEDILCGRPTKAIGH